MPNRKGNDDDDEYMGEKLVAPPDFSGPTGKRHCTDVLCTLLMIIMWACMTYIGLYAIKNGDYRLVVYPLDYDGNVCGTDFAQDMTDYPYLFYVNSWTGGVCVKKCPSLKGLVEDNLTDIRTMITYGGIWQTDGAQLDPSFIEMGDYSNSSDALFCTEDLCFPNNDPTQSWQSDGVDEGNGFAYYVGDSYPWLSRCYLTDAAEESIASQVLANATLSQGDDTYEFFNKLFGDLWTAREYILGFGFCVALVVSFCYIFLMRLPILLNFIVWASIFIAIAMFALAGVYAINQAQLWDTEDPQRQSETTINATRITGIVLCCIGGLLFFIMCCLRKQIQLAIGCVKEAGKAINRMGLILLVPVLQAAGFIAFMVVFTVYAVHLASLGEISTYDVPISSSGLEIAFRTYEFDAYIERSAWYFLFCFFWTSNFIVAVGDMIISMAVAKWYFTWDKKKVHSGYVLGSIWHTLWYHLGTCAYGSLVLAVIQLIRAFLAKVQQEVKKANSKIADCLLCCCQCCLWCFEKCIRFLNKNAYIQTAIFGTSFCKSAREAFFLILRNIGRIGAITYISSAVLIVGKVFISAVTTGLSYYAMNEAIQDELYSIVGPLVFVFLISYFVSDMFLDVFDMGITTVLQCFIADEEMFDGDQCYAEGDLQRWIDNYE